MDLSGAVELSVRRLRSTSGGSSCSVVIDTDPDGWRTRVVETLGLRPHPEIAVVDSPDAVARRRRRAARHLLGPTPG